MNQADILTNVDMEFVGKPIPSCVSEPTNDPTGGPDLFQGKKTDANIIRYGQ